MKAIEFTTWLKGFMDALESAPSKKQMAIIREKLENISDSTESIPDITLTPGIVQVPYNPPFTRPGIDPYVVTCDSGTPLVSVNGANSSNDTLFCTKVNSGNIPTNPLDNVTSTCSTFNGHYSEHQGNKK